LILAWCGTRLESIIRPVFFLFIFKGNFENMIISRSFNSIALGVISPIMTPRCRGRTLIEKHRSSAESPVLCAS
jgi:hypothetical protein